MGCLQNKSLSLLINKKSAPKRYVKPKRIWIEAWYNRSYIYIIPFLSMLGYTCLARANVCARLLCKLVVSLQGRLRQTTTFCVKTNVHMTKCEKITFTTISPYSHKPLLTAQHLLLAWATCFHHGRGKAVKRRCRFLFPSLSLSLSLSLYLYGSC